MFARGASAYVVRPGSFIRHVNRFRGGERKGERTLVGTWSTRFGSGGLVVPGKDTSHLVPLQRTQLARSHSMAELRISSAHDRFSVALRSTRMRARWLSVARPGPAVARAPRPALDRSGARSATRRRGRARPRGLAWGLWPVRARAAARRRPDGRGVHVTPTACSSKH